MHPLISADELAQADGVTVLDVRWTVAAPDGRPAYLDGHIPGAVYVDLETELSDHTQQGRGRHPLPGAEQLTRAMRRWGLHDGDAVVVMDDSFSQAAARAWWMLRDAGVDDVRILDGGLAAWVAAGHPLDRGDVVPEPGDATARPGRMPVVTSDEAATLPADGVLVDARAAERYRGEVEPVDPRAGHIPGAVSMPAVANHGPDGRFRSADELRAAYAAIGVESGTRVAVSCGSGVTAANTIAVLEAIGVEAALFPGSWSQWIGEGRPGALGAEPYGDASATPGGAPRR